MQIYLLEVLDWHAELNAQEKWDEKAYSPSRKKLLSALESISGYNPESLLKRLPADALYEERAHLLGKMNQHELALSLYVHKVFCIKYQSVCSLFIHAYNVILRYFYLYWLKKLPNLNSFWIRGFVESRLILTSSFTIPASCS